MKKSTLIVAVLSAAVAGVATRALAQDAGGDVPTLTQTLGDAQSRPDQRESAARRLLSRPGPAARTVLVDALRNSQQPAGQVAVARALSDIPAPDPQFIAPLFDLLAPNSPKAAIDAAAQALTAYKGNADVVTRLLAIARDGTDERMRLAAIKAAGTFVEKRVAETLVALLDPGRQQPSIVRAADAALSNLTGRPVASYSPADWANWWGSQRERDEVEFRSALADVRSRQFDRVTFAQADLETEITRLATDQYERAPREQRPDVLLRLLVSNNATLRAIGCELTAQAAQADAMPANVREQLRVLVGDPTPEVRRGAAGALALINDRDALQPLLTQLAQEPDSTVRESIAKALQPIRDVRAVPLLLKLLDDPRIETAQAAAAALAEPELGARLRQENPDLAAQAADQIWKTLEARTSPQQNIDLRNGLVRAITPLKSKQHVAQMSVLLFKRAEPAKVIRSLLAAVGALENPDFAGAIAGYTDFAEDPAVRRDAVKALGQASVTFEFQSRFEDRINESIEKDPEVRAAAWQVLTTLFPKAESEQLSFWADRLKRRPEYQVVVLKELRSRARVKDDQNLVARYNQMIGDAASAVGAWDEAIKAYGEALEHARSTNKQSMEEIISEPMLLALLKSRKYTEAMQFMQQQVRRIPALGGQLPLTIRSEVDYLINGDRKDFPSARALLNLVLALTPPLRQADQFRQLERDLDRRLKEQNKSPGRNYETEQNARIE